MASMHISELNIPADGMHVTPGGEGNQPECMRAVALDIRRIHTQLYGLYMNNSSVYK